MGWGFIWHAQWGLRGPEWGEGRQSGLGGYEGRERGVKILPVLVRFEISPDLDRLIVGGYHKKQKTNTKQIEQHAN